MKRYLYKSLIAVSILATVFVCNITTFNIAKAATTTVSFPLKDNCVPMTFVNEATSGTSTIDTIISNSKEVTLVVDPEGKQNYFKINGRDVSVDSSAGRVVPAGDLAIVKAGQSVKYETLDRTCQSNNISFTPKNECWVVLANGYGGGQGFSDAVLALPEFSKYKVKSVIVPSSNRIDTTASNILSKIGWVIDNNLTSDLKPLILVAAHSLAAIAAYNYQDSSGYVDNYFLYDPPYLAANSLPSPLTCPVGGTPKFGLEWLFNYDPEWLSNANEILTARNNHIDTSTNAVIWSSGYNKHWAPPGCGILLSAENEEFNNKQEALHKSYTDPRNLTDIKYWLDHNCSPSTAVSFPSKDNCVKVTFVNEVISEATTTDMVINNPAEVSLLPTLDDQVNYFKINGRDVSVGSSAGRVVPAGDLAIVKAGQSVKYETLDQTCRDFISIY